MLRYLASGRRNFTTSPVPLFSRMNWEFYAITQGSAAPFFHNDEEPILRQRTLWLLKPQKRYGWKGNGKSCLRVAFHFSKVPQMVEEAMGNRNFLTVRLTARDSVDLVSLAKELDPHFKKPHQFSVLHCERALLTLSLLVLREEKLQMSMPYHQRDEERIERAISWYSLHLPENPCVDDVATAIHMSGANLRAITKKIHGVSPHKLLRDIQIKRACEILANTDEKLDQVAGQCGFQSVEDFCRVFKNEMKVSADVWRRYT